MVFVSMAFAAFGSYGAKGILVSTVISTSMLLACCIATRDQLYSMFGLIACATIGLLTAGLFGVVLGCVAGILFGESIYAESIRRQLADDFKQSVARKDS